MTDTKQNTERYKDLNVDSGLAAICPPDTSLELFRKMCMVRYCEAGMMSAVEGGDMKCYLYLTNGEEAVPAGH